MTPQICRQYMTTMRVPMQIRSANLTDRTALGELQRETISESADYYVSTPAEYERDWNGSPNRLEQILAGDNSIWLIADIEGYLVGSLDFMGGTYERTRHVGTFGLTVRRENRNQGIGGALVETLLIWARDHPVIEKLTCSVFSNNLKAMSLYTRFGFQTEGRRHREYRMQHGRYLDAIILSKWIK